MRSLSAPDTRGWDNLSSIALIHRQFYAGLHLIAWTAPFPSPTKKTLWRLSGLTLATSGPLYFIYYKYLETGEELS